MSKQNNAVDWYRLEPRYENIGITNTAGTTFTVNSADGTGFSSSNCGYVTLPYNTAPNGRFKLYSITANQSFTQANISNNGFNITKTVNHANDIPFFIYAVSKSDDTACTFMVSTYPNTKISPVAGKIGKTGSAVANSQGSFFALDSSITVANYASTSCLCIGSFRMTYATAGTNWTITTFDIRDGIGQFQENRAFTLSIGQYGANAGTYFIGGTPPTFVTNSNSYYVNQDNFLYFSIAFFNSTAGVGTASLELASPYILSGGILGVALVSAPSVPTTIVGLISQVTPGPNNQIVIYSPGAVTTANAILKNNNIGTDTGFALDYQFTNNITFS